MRPVLQAICFMISGLLISPDLLFARGDDTITVAFIMPFCSKQVMANPNNADAELGNACREYYQGARIALEALKKSGVNIRVRLYDTEKDSMRFKDILRKPEVQKSDIIFGPVIKEGHTMMAAFAKQYKVYHVSPLLTLTKTKLNDPYLFSVHPDLAYYADFLAAYIQRNFGVGNVITLSDKGNSDKIIADRLKQIASKYPNLKFKFMDIGNYSEIHEQVAFGKTNHVIVSSGNNFLVNNVLRLLSDSNQFTDIYTYGFEKWLDFTTIDAQTWQDAHVHILTPFFVNYNEKPVRDFVEQYMEFYYCEPNEFAFSGYDQLTFFIRKLQTNKKILAKLDNERDEKLLSNSYKFISKPDSYGMENSRLNLVKMESFMLQLVSQGD